MKTILAPIDFSPVTDRVCETAIELAQAVNGRVVLLHSVPPPVVTSDYGPMLTNIAEIAATSERAASNQLKQLEERLGKRYAAIETVQFNGAPVAHILAQADALQAAYIVIGSHGHSALYNLLVGSTANGVLKHAHCPVVIVPPEPSKKHGRS